MLTSKPASTLKSAIPAYDIVKKEDNNFVWVEAAHEIQSAKKRVMSYRGTVTSNL
jgi:hypothetical protein